MKFPCYRPYVWLITLFLSANCSAITTYEANAPTDLMAGGWDVNIFADDVHFHHGGIITNIEMHLAIRGNQQCTLWIFEDLGQEPLYTTAFTNIPSDWAKFKTYQFPLYLDVPKDLYIGFSAQGNGWNQELTDFSDNATNISSGIAFTPGSYWWGPISGRQLIDGGVYQSFDHFRLKIDMLQPDISDFSVSSTTCTFDLNNLSAFATHSVERTSSLSSNTWNKTVMIFPGPTSVKWSETREGPEEHTFYRIRVEHDD